MADTYIDNITELKHVKSTFPPLTTDLGNNPFFIFFTTHPKFPDPQDGDEAVWDVVSNTWNSILGPEHAANNMRSGPLAVNTMLGWVSQLRSSDRWSVPNDHNFLGKLREFRDLLHKSTTSLPAAPAEETQNQHPAAPLDQVDNPLSDLTIAPTNDPNAQHPKGIRRTLPAAYLVALAQIEDMGTQDSTIAVGTPNDKFYATFSKFTLPHLDNIDELWENLDGPLNAVIGRDVLQVNLRRGKHGADGLMRSWITSARAYAAWTSAVDGLFLPKLEGVVKCFKSTLACPKLCTPSPTQEYLASHAPPPAQQSPTRNLTKHHQHQAPSSNTSCSPSPTSNVVASSRASSPAQATREASPPALSAPNKPSTDTTQALQASMNTVQASKPLTTLKASMETILTDTRQVAQPSTDTTQASSAHPPSAQTSTPTISNSNVVAAPGGNDTDDDDDSPTGVPLPVNDDVNDPRFKIGRVTIWKSPTPALDIRCQSALAKRLNHHDCQIIYNEIGKLLYLRLSAPTAMLYDPAERVPSSPPIVQKKIPLTRWIESSKPSLSFCFLLV